MASPDVEGGVRAPGTPSLGAGGELLFVEAGGLAEDEVAGGESIGVAEGAHGIVIAGPGADAADVFESFVFGQDGSGVSAEGFLAGGGEADRREVSVGELLSGGHFAERSHETTGQGARSGDGDLLAEDGADTDFKGVPGAGHAEAGAGED